MGVLVSVALIELAARASPRGIEAMYYSLLMSAANLGGTGSDVLISWLNESLHISLLSLIYLSAGTTLPAMLAVPLIPHSILTRRDFI